MLKISVIMSVYNTQPDWLKESIDSILNQTYSNFEFIIVNDGSTEDIDSVINSYNDSRIVYIKQENSGLPVALNKAISVAKGEYIARMDSDDISVLDRFQKQVKYLEENPGVSVVGGWFENTMTKKVFEAPAEVSYLRLLYSCCMVHPSVMFRKKDFEKYEYKYNENFRVAQDYELWSRVIRNLKMANIQEVLLKYRWHDKNASVLRKKEQEGNAYKVRQAMLNWLSSDIKYQHKIMDMLYEPEFSFWEKIFSIKNQNNLYGEKYKIYTILGIKIKLKRNK